MIVLVVGVVMGFCQKRFGGLYSQFSSSSSASVNPSKAIVGHAALVALSTYIIKKYL